MTIQFWNKPSIEFYRAMGAVPMDDWTVYRIAGDQLKKLSGHAGNSERSESDGEDTNAMRMLDKAKIEYRTKEYEVDENDLSGSHAADMMGVDHGSVFKTLVLKGEKMGYLVCCIPVDAELDLKKTARAAGDKKVEMIHMKDLLAVTGYIRGGCSPIGMKKQFPTFVEESAVLYDEIALSAGLRGQQILISPQTLVTFIQGKFASLTFEQFT